MIKEHLLLRMPNRASLSVLGDKARFYYPRSDGDLLLALKICFNDAEIAAALQIGGEIVTGYGFDYHYPVSLKQAGVRGWCAYPGYGYGLALTREVAEKVSSASYAEFMRDIQRCYEEQERKRRIYEEIEQGRRGRLVY
jgi:hypothetical protein